MSFEDYHDRLKQKLIEQGIDCDETFLYTFAKMLYESTIEDGDIIDPESDAEAFEDIFMLSDIDVQYPDEVIVDDEDQ